MNFFKEYFKNLSYFKRINLIGGWLVFAVSFIVYLITMEPTASLWDCSEFIATSYKLEVGHPPGAPLFMMLNRIFTMFAPSPSSVAMMVNTASAMASGLTIAFLFWTIAHLAMRLQGKRLDTVTIFESKLSFAAAFIGSLAYAFTYTFWFSAIEGEVYAQSSLFTALVFWAMLRWENEADSPHATRWIILVSYLIGLSIGIHLLNLLAIPALVLVYYYRKVRSRSRLMWWKVFGLSIVILGFVLFGIIGKIPTIGAYFDRVAVNTFGLPVNIGFMLFFLLLLGALGYAIYYTHKKGKVVLNTILLCGTVIIMGYSSYASVVIRSMANPPMNSNAPSDPYQLIALLGREQYGNTPLVTGQYYSSPMVDYDTKKDYYYDSEQKKYIFREIPDAKSIKYAEGTTTLFPRLYSDGYEEQYKSWVRIKGRNVNTKQGVVNIPTFSENLQYFFNYQLNHMYWRYFLWNFVGRQNDIQSDGGVLYGNWMSGIDFIDKMHLGNVDNIPDHLKENRGRNHYYFLPFLLGLAGIFFQLKRDKDNFNIVMFLFLMTGIAIILYLNQTPNQPRERDYAYAGSFYAFSIWIGLGLLWVYDILSKIKQLNSNKIRAIAATAVSLTIPVILLAENWDDHDRRGRYFARDIGVNYLESTLPNSIILPYGDNDSFPLWYNQEVEGVRTDVKISNISYLASDWYTHQMKDRTNDAAPIKLTIPKRVYYKNNDYMRIAELVPEYTIQELLDFIADNSQTKRNLFTQRYGLEPGEEIIPTRRIAIPVNKENALKSGIVKPEDAHLMVDTIYINLPKGKNSLDRSEYIFLDMLGSADWARPIYVTNIPTAKKFGLDDYLQQDGIAYRIVPIKTVGRGYEKGRIDSDYLYDKLMNKFVYGNISDPKVNVDQFIQNSLSASQLRFTFSRLAAQLIKEGDTKRANEVVDRALKEIPHYQLPYDTSSEMLMQNLYDLGRTEEADTLLEEIKDYHLSNLNYYTSFSERYFPVLTRDMQITIYTLGNLYVLGRQNKRDDRVKDLKEYYDMVSAN